MIGIDLGTTTRAWPSSKVPAVFSPNRWLQDDAVDLRGDRGGKRLSATSRGQSVTNAKNTVLRGEAPDLPLVLLARSPRPSLAPAVRARAGSNKTCA